MYNKEYLEYEKLSCVEIEGKKYCRKNANELVDLLKKAAKTIPILQRCNDTKNLCFNEGKCVNLKSSELKSNSIIIFIFY